MIRSARIRHANVPQSGFLFIHFAGRRKLKHNTKNPINSSYVHEKVQCHSANKATLPKWALLSDPVGSYLGHGVIIPIRPGMAKSCRGCCTNPLSVHEGI